MQRRMMKTVSWLLGAALLSASLVALAPASPAHATTRPVLFVGGHTNQLDVLEGWADYIGPKLALADDKVRGVELVSAPGWDYPLDDPAYTDWPGSGSNEDSADVIQTAIEALHAAYGPVDVIGVSQGAIATRYLLQQNPSNIRSKVAGYVSFSGANAGVPDNALFGPCETWELMPMCEEIVFEVLPGDADWLEDNVNRWNYLTGATGDPTPGTVAYFHIYTANDGETLNNWFGQEWEALTPYGWSVPLLGATNRSAQDECGSTYLAPHGGWSGSGLPDLVMEDLLIDALNRRTLDAPSGLC